MQVPDAAYTLNISNTSNVPHTFTISLAGLPAGWGLFEWANLPHHQYR